MNNTKTEIKAFSLENIGELENLIYDINTEDRTFGKDTKIQLTIENPATLSDLEYALFKSLLIRNKKKFQAIYIPKGGNMFSTEDGKMILFKRENGIIELIFATNDLKHAKIPDGTEIITEMVFSNSDIESVYLPDSIKEIGAASFAGCTKLTEIIIPENVRTIGHIAFEKCESLKNVKLGNQIRKISECAFNECKSLTEVELPEKLQYISEFMFSDCESLKKVAIKNNVIRIEYAAFCGCKNLTDIKLPEGLARIDTNAFIGCSSLKELTLPESLRTVEAKSLDIFQRIRISKPVPRLARAFVSYNGEDISSISVSFKDRTFVFPKYMGQKSAKKASDILYNSETMDPGVYSYHEFAGTTESKQQTALDALIIGHDEAIRKYVKRSASAIMIRTAEKDEESFLGLIRTFSKEEILNDKLIKKALEISKDKGWLLVSAELLQVLDSMDEKKKSGFRL